MIKINREELAWAAGFFDGEGCTFINKSRSNHIRIDIRQTLPAAVLYKFQNAVGGIGIVRGPYKATRSSWSDFYTYSASGFEDCQAIISLLWNWLSEVKKKQYIRSMESYLESCSSRDSTKFKCGHPRVDTNIYQKWDNKARKYYPTCLECLRDRSRRAYYKKRIVA